MKRKITFIIYALVIWFAAFLVWEWAVSYPKVRWSEGIFPQSPAEKIDSILVQGMVDFLLPGVAAGIVENGKITYLKSFGYQNLETKDSLTLQSQIPVASISKIFTALAAANYFSSLGYSSNTPLGDISPESNGFLENLKEIKLSQLLTHTSGLKDPGAVRRLFQFNFTSELNQLPSQLKNKQVGTPVYQYADLNFDLLGFVLEQMTQTPFESLIDTLTLQKAGMASSFFATEWPIAGDSIQGYERTFLWKRLETKPLRFDRSPSPSSSLIVTPEDLAMALIHLSRGHMSDFQKELEWLTQNTEMPIGFQQIQLNGQNFIGHFGEQAGFSSIVMFSSDWEVGFFILTNAKDNFDHRRQFANAIATQLSSRK